MGHLVNPLVGARLPVELRRGFVVQAGGVQQPEAAASSDGPSMSSDGSRKRGSRSQAGGKKDLSEQLHKSALPYACPVSDASVCLSQT